MSSRRFVVVLKPDPIVRHIVMLCGCAAALVGCVLLIRIPASLPIRLLLNALWLAGSIWELGKQSRGIHRIRSIRLQLGEAMIIDRHGRQVPVQIMSGSIVLPRLAWLRLKRADGLTCGVFLRGDPAVCKQWRRLQIMWRQGTAPFGGSR